jgi:hypothetical protein
MEQKKKLTNAQMQKRIENAIVFVPKTKDTVSIFFSDKGVRLIADNDGCVIETNYHRHVFSNITAAGVSRPWIYTKRVIEIANDNIEAIKTESGYSFQKLLEVLKAKEDKSEYNIVTFVDWWLMVIFDGLYSIGESEIESFLVYFKYIGIIATNSILLDEHKEDMTNKQFIQKFFDNIKVFTDNLTENILFPKKTDEEMMKEEIEAIQQTEQEQAMEAQTDGAGKD